MNYVEFQEWVQGALCERLPEGTTVETKKVLKNNKVEKVGLLVTWKESNLSPVIYLEYYYAMYENGKELDEIVDEMQEVCMQNRIEYNFDMAFFTDWNKAKEKITFKLVNFEENKEMLEKLPHRRFLDLAVIYQYVVELGDESVSSITINDAYMEIWCVRESDLYERARQNYSRMMQMTVKSMNQLLGEIMEGDMEDVLCESVQMYVVTNKTLHNGAASMLFFQELKETCELFRHDLYILPSSVHEIIVLPVEFNVVDELRKMVCEVNETLMSEDKLSNQVYRYYCEREIIEIA